MDSNEYRIICNNAINTAKLYDYKKLTLKFEKLIKYENKNTC